METFSDLIYALDGALALIEVLEQQTLVQPIMFFLLFFVSFASFHTNNICNVSNSRKSKIHKIHFAFLIHSKDLLVSE